MNIKKFEYKIDADVRESVNRSGADVEQLRGKTIFVTGATGFFGIWILSALIDIKRVLAGDLVIIALTRSPDQFISRYTVHDFDKEIEFIEGDIREFKLPQEIQITHLVHMATTSASETFHGENQVNKLDMLYRGTKHLFQQASGSLESVVFTSSGVVYGLNDKEQLSEEDFGLLDPLDYGSALALGKLSAEYLVSSMADKEGYKFSIARCFAFAGQYLPLDLHYAFGNFVADALSGKPIVVKGDGLDQRSYMYIGDAVACLLQLLIEPKNDIFNLGSEKPIQIKALAGRANEYSGARHEIKVENALVEVGNFRRRSYIPPIKKIRKSYPHLNEWTSVYEIIEKMFQIRT